MIMKIIVKIKNTDDKGNAVTADSVIATAFVVVAGVVAAVAAHDDDE